ncbi:MAG TPA: hypothetical protein VHB79_20360 [Polyangiaceae bacterium]|nr:hypothetical protein [Polyangiaceae bacterium]
MSLPLFSVSALAFAGAMPFNGASVGTAALLLLALAPSLGSEPVPRSSTSVMVWAFMLVELGWLYPHFLAESFTLHYLYRAPLGVLPCPTLAAVMGLALLVHGFEARAWSSVLAVFGLFYGLFGAIRLGVAMDLLLVLGGLILLGVVWSNEHARTAGARTARA